MKNLLIMFLNNSHLTQKSRNYFLIRTFFLFYLFSSQLFAQEVSINEVVSSNSTINSDEDGEYQDWIEIYNYGTTDVNLSGFGLSDQTDNAFKWVFPTINLAPKQYLLVWASDKNRALPNSELHTNFKIKSGGETVILTNASGTKLSESSAVAIPTDTSYGRSPDGTGSWSFFTNPTPNDSNTGATTAEPEKVAFNEIVSSNISGIQDEDNAYEDWIELYNYGTSAVNLSGFGLSDDRDLPYKWVFPSVTINAGEYILVWASDKNKTVAGNELHTNFKISTNGETLFLTNTAGILVSGSPSVSLEDDASYGRKPDGTGEWLYFSSPTPLSSNLENGATTSLEPPLFSHDSGMYSEGFNLSLTSEIQGASIVYTTDGSEPDINNLSGTTFTYKNDYPFEVGESEGPLLNETFISKTYSSPLSIVDRSDDSDKLANKNTRQEDIYIPPIPVRKATIIKAKTFLNGKGSETSSRTFFIWSEGNPYNTPIVSMQLNEEFMFGYDNGIYTSGIDFDTWRAERPTNPQGIRPDINNYWRRGREWEHPVNVELFDKNLKSVMNINGGFRIHGNTSRLEIIKSVRLYARSDYDAENEFEHELFDQQIPDSPLPYNDKFKRILLRGNGSGGYIANDVVFHRLMQPVFNGVSRIQTAIHFFNGEYWGITALRDRFDKHHFSNNFDVDSENFAILDCKGGTCVSEEGESEYRYDYRALRDFIVGNDMSITSNYEEVEGRLDIDSFMNHLMLEIFAEGDSYEIKYWRAKVKENDAFGDTRWRLTTQDFEAAMSSRTNWLADFASKSNIADKAIFANLLDNEVFKNKFINRFADLLNTAFLKERFDAIVNQTFDEINPLLAEDKNRSPRLRFYTELDDFDKNRLLEWIKVRPAALRDQINELFNVEKTIDLTVEVSNNNAGFVTLNSVDLKSTTPGVNDNPYPWSGVYFSGIPITLKANSRPGYTFSHWSGDSSSTNSEITITPSADLELQANFTPDVDFSHLLYFWLLDDEISNDTPIESLNSTYSRNNLTAIMNYNSSLTGYPFDENNSNWRKASLERINKPTDLNYQTLANNNIAFDSKIMKGLQIKQPFSSGDAENYVELDFSTVGYEDLKVSLAINSDGAADSIVGEYWNGSSWVSNGLPNNTQSLTTEFERKEFDFSSVSLANENNNFKIRFRFRGSNMTQESGKKVVFNNIAISAIDKNVLSIEEFQEQPELSIYPNPTKDKIIISSSKTIENVLVYNVFGKLIHKSPGKLNSQIIDLSSYSKGIYLIKVFSDGFSKTKKIVKE